MVGVDQTKKILELNGMKVMLYITFIPFNSSIFYLYLYVYLYFYLYLYLYLMAWFKTMHCLRGLRRR
jgi:hypothetical protein